MSLNFKENGYNHANGNGRHSNEQTAELPHLILAGPQGVGKGTQAAKLVEKYDYTHVESGQVFRNLMKNNGDSPLAQKIREITGKGELVPDEVTMRVMEPHLNFNKRILLDGIPRSKEQARILQDMLGNRDYLVMILSLPKEKCVERIAQRVQELQAAGKPVRADDLDPAAVERRLRIYEEETADALTGSFNLSRIRFIDAGPEIDLVTASIYAQIDEIVRNPKMTPARS